MKRYNAFALSRFRISLDGKDVVDFSGSAAIAGYFFDKYYLNKDIGGVSSNIFITNGSKEFREKLSKLTGKRNVYLTSSATEACDIALSNERKNVIISLEGAYHGLTYLAKKVSFENGIDYENKIIHLPFPESDNETEIEKIVDLIDNVSRKMDLSHGVFIYEPIQVHAGVRPIGKNFVSIIKELKNRYDLVLISDEAYTGYGRSGYFIYSRKIGLEPDVIIFGKGIAGDIPMGAICTDKDYLSETGVMGTLSGNARASYVAIKLLDLIMEEVTTNRVLKLSERIKKLFDPLPSYINSIRGSGFVLGVEFTKDALKANLNEKFRDELINNGVVCNLVGNNRVLKITPPVLINDDDFNAGIEAIEKTIANFTKN